MNRAGERLFNGLVKENPTLVLMLGMCPTLAVTTSAVNGFGMGATTLAVLAMSNLIISLLRNIIPRRVRIPAFIVIIASFVTVVELLMQAYLPSLNKALGVYIPLIVVNCIILGRAESYAYSNPPVPALFDGIGMGLGFTVALTVIGAVRELLGAGELFGFRVLPDSYEPMLIFVLAPGAFFVLAALTALQNYVRERLKKAGKPYEKIGSGCAEDCMNCADTGCSRRFYDMSGDDPKPEEPGDQELEYHELGHEAENDLEYEDLESTPEQQIESGSEAASPESEEGQPEYEEPAAVPEQEKAGESEETGSEAETQAAEEAGPEESEPDKAEEDGAAEPEADASEEAESEETGSEAETQAAEEAVPEEPETDASGEAEPEETGSEAETKAAEEAGSEEPETGACEEAESEEAAEEDSEESESEKSGAEEPKREQKAAVGQKPSGDSRNQGAGNRKKSAKKKKKHGKKGGK